MIDAGSIETRNVFIDTEYFDSINFDFIKTAIKELIRHAKNGRAKIFLASITLGEMRDHIETGVKKANRAVKSFRDEGRILWNLPELPIHAANSSWFRMFLKPLTNGKANSPISPKAATSLMTRWFCLWIPIPVRRIAD